MNPPSANPKRTWQTFLRDAGKMLRLAGQARPCLSLAAILLFLVQALLFMGEAASHILGEPTSAIDAQAESEIIEQFVALTNGRTSLLISHRFSTVRMADIIAVLENGVVTACGSHAELMADKGLYRYANDE